jgi:hypothetical protein
MEKLYASYNGHVEFLIVYIREAHPEMLKEGHKTGVVGRPDNIDERVILATECVSQFKFTMPMVIDGMDGKVNSDYQAAPVRVTIADIDGKVAFYAGRGPFDFRLPPVERTIKKLIANDGRMPPPPKPQWSEAVNGLRCGLSLDPEKVTIGEQLVAQLKFENTTDKPISFYNKVEGAADRFVIYNDSGIELRLQAARGTRLSRRRRGGSSSLQTIAPGQTFETQVEGKIVAASDGAEFNAGQFHAVYNLETNERTPAGLFRSISGQCDVAGEGKLRRLPRRGRLSPREDSGVYKLPRRGGWQARFRSRTGSMRPLPPARGGVRPPDDTGPGRRILHGFQTHSGHDS